MSQHSKKIDDRIKQLEQVCQKLRVQAKQNLAKAQACKGAQHTMYKNKALMALNKKKQYENQMNSLMNQQMTIQKVNMTTQNIKNHQQMMHTMQHAVNTQKQAMKNVNVDKFADLQDQMLDMKFESDYMNHILNQNYDLDVDQDQIDDELAEFQRQIAMDKKKAVNINPGQKQPQQQQQASKGTYKNQDIESMLKGL